MKHSIHQKIYARTLAPTLKKYILLSIFICLNLFLCACKQEVDYFHYVSELRSNIFLAKNEEFSLRIYAVKKESPYNADGIPKETYDRTEIYLSTPSADHNIHFSFSVKGELVQGEMSYDNIKGEYYLYFPIDISELVVLECNIEDKNTVTTLQAVSVLQKDTLSPKKVLDSLVKNEKELFSALTDKYGFTGEIYLRLIYEDAPYYYVGIIDRGGNIHAFLMSATTGKILAKRQS